MATMSDFVFPHPDGLATYRVYEKVAQFHATGEVEVLNGEAIDIAVCVHCVALCWTGSIMIILWSVVDVAGIVDSLSFFCSSL